MAILTPELRATSTSSDLGITHTLTTPVGSSRIVLAGVVYLDVFGVTFEGCTYNGVSMTQAISESQSVSGTLNAKMFYLLDSQLPATTGGYSCVFDFTTGFAFQKAGFVVELTNFKQQAPTATSSAKYTGSVSSWSQNITVLKDDFTFEMIYHNPATITPTASQTELFENNNGGNTTVSQSGLYLQHTTAGAKTLSGTTSSASAGLIAEVVSFAPLDAGAFVNNFFIGYAF